MSRHFILDGYNVLHAAHRWADLPREAQRRQFLLYLEENRHSRSERNTITVVFDGYAAALSKIRLQVVRLVFSGGQDADTVIKEWVADLAHPGDAVVVTNDRGIRTAVRGSGAQVMTCDEFLQLGSKKPARQQRHKVDSPSADAINRELKRLWKLD